MRTFFQPNEFSKFTQCIVEYCTHTMKNPISLTDHEVDQLSWYMNSAVVTPEASSKDISEKLHFEIKRGLARRYSFELLLRGDEDAYVEFISAQKKEMVLSRENFSRLSAEAHALTDDVKTIIRVTCLLTITEKAKSALTLPSGIPSNDSEEFLSQLGEFAIINKHNFPILNELTDAQLLFLKKAFWPNMHFRHMMFTEGGVNMTQTFRQGVLSNELRQDDFRVWQWRWLTNLFGFQLGSGAKYFDAETSQLCDVVIQSLQTIFSTPDKNNFVEEYLMKRAEIAGFDVPISLPKKLILGHLAAYFHQINILTPELGRAIDAGYSAFCNENPDNRLHDLYLIHFQNKETITPTYVPAVLNNAFAIFKKTMKMDDLSAIASSTHFMCQFLDALYLCPTTQRISCMALAQEKTLEPMLVAWLDNHLAIQFSFIDGIATRKSEPVAILSV